MKPLLVFDYDGTIHESMKVYLPAVRRIYDELSAAGRLNKPWPGDKKISSYLGLNAKEMWADFAPELSIDEREECSRVLTSYIFENVEGGLARWYPDMEMLLDRLKALGYRMVILSNSKKINGEIFFRVFSMDRWFDKWYDTESYNWVGKGEIIKFLAKDYGLLDENGHLLSEDCMVVVGDRFADKQAARDIGCKFTGCCYGYGNEDELSGADYYINYTTTVEYDAFISYLEGIK